MQIGDPFTGKKLIESSVELTSSGLVESLQDCGAAGIASSLSEMAADFGIDVHLDRVLREVGMFREVMISESQERMIAVVRPQMLEAVEAVLDRWELEHAVIGEVTATGQLRAFWQDDVVGAIPARLLTEECPRYEVAQARRPPSPPQEIVDAPPAHEALVELLGSPALRSREFVFRRYDQLVGSCTVRRPGFDAAVLRLRPSMRGLAISLDGQGRIARLDPYTGGALAVLEAARNVACTASRSASRTASTSATRRSRRSAGSYTRSTASQRRARPRSSGRVGERLAVQRDERPGDPSDSRRRRRRTGGGRRARAEGGKTVTPSSSRSARAIARGLRVPGSVRRVGGAPLPLDLDAEARLVSFLWHVAPLATLVHDAAEGGLAVCLAESAIHSDRRRVHRAA